MERVKLDSWQFLSFVGGGGERGNEGNEEESVRYVRLTVRLGRREVRNVAQVKFSSFKMSRE